MIGWVWECDCSQQPSFPPGEAPLRAYLFCATVSPSEKKLRESQNTQWDLCEELQELLSSESTCGGYTDMGFYYLVGDNA